MRKNKIDELFDSIEAGDCANIEQQNNQHLTQMKTLLDEHLAQQRNILNEFKNEYKAISNEINAIKGEMTKDRKLLQKALSRHEDEINRVISYQEGVYLSRHVYNRWKYVFLALMSIVAGVLSMIVAYIFK